MSKMDELTDALNEAVAEAVSNAVDEVDIADKVNDAVSELDWEEIISDKVDLTDLVKDHADFDTAAVDAIEFRLPQAVADHLEGLDWSNLIERYGGLSSLVRGAADDKVQESWHHHQKVTDHYIETKLEDGLRDLVDRNLAEQITPLLGEIEMLKLEIAKLKDRKPWYRRVFGL